MLKQLTRQITSLTPEHTDGKLKEVPQNVLGGHTPRSFMIDFGQLMRQYSNDELYWVNATLDKLQSLPPDQKVYIGDCRFRNEADLIKERGGIIIRLERYPKLNMYTPSNDRSETDLDRYDFDAVLPAGKNIHPQHLEVFADEINDYVKQAIDKCKTDYSRFNLIFRNCWGNHS